MQAQISTPDTPDCQEIARQLQHATRNLRTLQRHSKRKQPYKPNQKMQAGQLGNEYILKNEFIHDHGVNELGSDHP